MGNTAPPKVGMYDLVLLVLSIYVLIMLGVEAALTLDEETSTLVSLLDTGVCFVFFCDFIRNLFRAPQKLRYLRTWGWIDLLSSIPAWDIFRLGRMGRVLRVIRVLRGLKSLKVLAFHIHRNRGQTAFLSALLISFLLVAFASIAILHLEDAPNSNIKGAENALWWAFITITTVGYGDFYPVTTEGRILAGALCSCGVGLFGAMTAFAAAWFMTPTSQEKETGDDYQRALELIPRLLPAQRRLLMEKLRDEKDAAA